MPCKEGHLLVDGKNKKADIEYPFENGEVINYTLDGVSIPSHYKGTGDLINSEVKETDQEFQHEANGDFPKVTDFNSCEKRKQQHCSYSITLTYLTE
jgi:hypothetical protein